MRNISSKLKISYKGVQSTVNRFESSGCLKDKPQPETPRITSKAEDIRIQIICKLNRWLTASQIRTDLNVVDQLQYL